MGVLDGVRVVEVAQWVAGPAAGGIMADWGADVIKVEAPRTGDPFRHTFAALGIAQTRVPPFDLDNRGKRSVALDLRTEAGRDVLWRLVESADVFLTNVRLDPLERMGFGPEQVLARAPRTVYALVTGYGATGPEAGRPGYDIGAYWARSSLAATLALPGEAPADSASALGDHTTAITTLAGILGALYERERTGRGRVVEASLLRTGIYANGWDVGVQLGLGRRASRRPRHKHPIPLVNSYRAGDGRWFWLIGLEQDRHWPGLVKAIERPELAADERFHRASARKEHAEALIAELDATFATRTRDDWAGRFDAHDVWWAPVNTIPDVIADPQARAAGAFVTMPVRDGEEPYESVASPVSFRGADTGPQGLVPQLGEHTDDVLRSVGYGDEDLAALRAAGALG